MFLENKPKTPASKRERIQYMNKVRVEIGGIGLSFRYKNCHIKEMGSESYGRHFISPGKNDIIINVNVSGLPRYQKNKTLFEAKENWRLFEDDLRYIFEIFQSKEKHHSNVEQHKHKKKNITKVCFIGKKTSKGEVYIAPGADDLKDDKAWSLEQLLRTLGHLIFTTMLHRYKGMAIHSLGIILNKEGIIFPGISGTGKTTLARLWQNRKDVIVLSDDRVIVRKVNGQYLVYGTPWPGEGRAASPGSAPLKRILFLSKAKKNSFISISRKEGLRRLLTQCFPAIWDKEGVGFSLEFCEMLVENIPCFSFGFVPDESAVEYVINKSKHVNRNT